MRFVPRVQESTNLPPTEAVTAVPKKITSPLCKSIPFHDIETWGLTWWHYVVTRIFPPAFFHTSTSQVPLFRSCCRGTWTLLPENSKRCCVTVHHDCSQVFAAMFWIFAASGHCSADRCHSVVCVCCGRTLLYPSGASQSSPRGTLSSFLSPLIKYLSFFAFLGVFC